MDRRITTSLTFLPQSQSERSTARFERMAKEEVASETEQTLVAQSREEAALEANTESLTESHEMSDRFMRLLEDDLVSFEKEEEVMRSRRATSQLSKPIERPIHQRERAPTINDMFDKLRPDFSRKELEQAARELRREQFAFERRARPHGAQRLPRIEPKRDDAAAPAAPSATKARTEN